MIRAGRVTVDGRPVSSPEAKFSRGSLIKADGVALDLSEYVYWMLNKPAGYVSASKDERWPAVVRLLPEEAQKRGVFCVGRLDADVTGILILTDDGGYAHRVTSPRAEIRKTYRVYLDSPVSQGDIDMLAAGVVMRDGTAYRPAQLVPDGTDHRSALVSVTEGKYHEVKNLMSCCGHRVLSMTRLSIGALGLDPVLEEGQARRMSVKEAEQVFC